MFKLNSKIVQNAKKNNDYKSKQLIKNVVNQADFLFVLLLKSLQKILYMLKNHELIFKLGINCDAFNSQQVRHLSPVSQSVTVNCWLIGKG